MSYKFEELQNLRESARKEGIPILRDSSFDLLTSLIFALKPKKILEIGTAYGCSSIGMLLACENSKLVTVEIDDDAVKKAKENFKAFGVSDRVEIHEGNASEIIPVISGKFDFIFLDGPKSHYLEYMPFLKELIVSGGVIFADNVLLKEYSLSEPEKRNRTAHRNMKAFIDAMFNDDDFFTRLIDLEDGLLIAVAK